MSNQAPPTPRSFVSTVPPDLLAQVTAHRVVEYGIGAGPGFAAIQTWKPSGGTSFEAALDHLERLRGIFKRAHIELEDGLTIYFEPQGYLRHSNRNN